ncbi:MAG: hypothetical protein GXO98_05885 [Nitrospirae bacterium]|nr:hypothetical protein [Nitrospirota bacterium]
MSVPIIRVLWMAGVLVISLWGLPTASGAEYYVDKDSLGGSASNTNPGTLTAPWQTIAKANVSVKAGDTVNIRKGTYRETISPRASGTETRRIMFRAFPSEKVTLTGVAFGIRMKGRSYVTIKGIDCIKTGRYVYLDNSHDIWIMDGVFDQATLKRGGPKGIRFLNNSHHNRIQRCWIGHSGYVKIEKSKTGLNDKGGLINIGNDVKPGDDSSYNLIEDNTIAYGGHDTMLIATSHNVIRNNYFHNEAWMPSPRDPNKKYGNRCIAGGGKNSGRNLFENNRIAFAGQPPDDDGAYGLERSSSFNIYRKNAFYYNGTAGIGLHSKWFGEASNNYIYFNTFYRNGVNKAIQNFHKGGISIQNYNGITPRNNVIKNNIFYKNFTSSDGWHKDRGFAVGGNVSLDDQVVVDNWRGAGDPLFVDDKSPVDPRNPNLPDFHLQAGSPCIDKGGWLTTVTSLSGSGKSFTVKDANYFMDGWGIIKGDIIQLENRTGTARITKVNYATNTITVDKALTWNNGQGVSLPYEGSKPDIGAYEY